MKPPRPALFASLVALLTALGPRAGAVERSCSAFALDSDSGFRSRFPELLARIEQELSRRTDIDACARVVLQGSDTRIVVAVTLPDGRAASRTLTRQEDVLPSLQALLLVPEPVVGSSSATRAPAPAPERAATTPTLPASRPRDVQSALPPGAARQLGFELSVLSGMRVGDGQFSYGAGLLSFLEVKRWLIGFQGRADGYRSLRGSDPETALELAILAGRRIDLGGVALDLTAGPGVAMRGSSISETQSVAVMMNPASPPPPPASLEEGGTGPSPRLLLGARLGFNPRSVFRTFVGVDGELGPRDTATSDAPTDVARIPTFSVGLALGATVGTP
jgi:hypothetical protein